jgi:monofunctional biosynthetic peptidoglycan transglycosylase
MDRADDTSEPTAAPNTASRVRVDAVPRPLEGIAASPVAPSAAAAANTTEHAAADVAGVELNAVDWRPAFANPPRPLPPWAFSPARAQPQPVALLTRLIVPLPLNPAAYVADVGAVAEASPEASPGASLAEPARAYLPPSVEATLEATLDGSGRSATPLSVDAALSEIEAEVFARTMTVEAAIAQVRRDRQIERRHGATPAQATPRIMSVVSALQPQLPIGPLVADPAARPDMSGHKAWPADHRDWDYKGLARRALKIIGVIAAAWLALVLILIVTYRFVNPPISELMLQRWAFGEDISQQWVDFEDMSPNVVRAVLVSEDARFCQHNGIDFEAIEDAVEDAGSGKMRGASTISMQVVKNLFLWPSKSFLRKAIELPLTYVLELVWPKRRIMEVYLNIAEWGPGIFGVETASRFYFKKPAKSLNEREAARLAVALPNPLTRNAGKPGPGTRRLASAVQVRMRFAPSSQTVCIWPKRRM